MESDFDYKKYSLENLQKWVEDAIGSTDATPQEIYYTIKHVVYENISYHENNLRKNEELLNLLEGKTIHGTI